MGCDGCELWNGTKRVCYAGTQTDGKPGRRGLAGAPGWPSSFGEPKLFLDRLAPALKWGPPTPKERDAKPWMAADMPRLIFLNDMGDTFSKKLALNWMAPLLPLMAESKHQFLLLTKRPSRMAEFSEKHPFPKNFWLGTSVTSHTSANRVEMLRKVQGGRLKFVSFEPLWSAIPSDCFEGIRWAIFGGESGDQATPCNIDNIRGGMRAAERANAAVFVKQLGSQPRGDIGPLKDSHGGDWDEWPADLRVRQFPILLDQPVPSLL